MCRNPCYIRTLGGELGFGGEEGVDGAHTLGALTLSVNDLTAGVA